MATTPSSDGGKPKIPVPAHFSCPVSMELMVDPVMVVTGHTYDRSCIQRWLESGNKTCPVTGIKLRSLELTPNFALRMAIQDWANANGIALNTSQLTSVMEKAVVNTAEGEDGVAVSSAVPHSVIEGHDEIVWAVEATDGRLFSASADKTIRVWDTETRRCLHVLEEHTRPVLSLAISDEHKKLFSGSYDCSIRVWDLTTYRRVKSLHGHTDAVRALAVAGDVLFSGSYDSTVRVWDAATLNCVAIFDGHQDNVRVLTADSKHLYSGSWDKTIRVWDMRTLRCVRVLEGHVEAVLALTVMKNHLISGSYDTTVRFWNTESFACVGKFEGHEDAVRVLTSTGEDADTVYSGSYDGSIGFWSEPIAAAAPPSTSAGGSGLSDVSDAMAGLSVTPAS